MGRYDKIRVYHDGQWKQPTQCRVYYNNAWQDLGTNDSYNTRSLYTLKNGNYVRATLNRQDYSVVTDRWAQGSFSLLPASGFCFCPKSSNAGNYNWYFRATIRKTSDTDQQIFRCGASNSYIRILWKADGHIQVTSSYNGTAYSMTTSNAVGANNTVYLNVYANKGSYTTYVEFNGVTTSGNLSASFRINNATNQVGDSAMQFRNNLSAAGVNGSGSTYSVSFDTSYASGSDGSQYSGVNHQESSSTGTNWV